MIDTARVKKQVIALLDAGTRVNGARVYSETLGDEGYLSGEIDTAILHAKLTVAEAICETDGHPDSAIFTVDTTVTHASELPAHVGTHGVPTITPFGNAGQTLEGRRKSYEEIGSYRQNPTFSGFDEKLYSDTDHDEADEDGNPSKLAGYYAVVENRFYFTGAAATVPLKIITAASVDELPNRYEPKIVNIALGKLAKDGTISEKYAYYAQMGMSDLNQIRTGEMPAPSLKTTVGTRDTGTK